MAYPPYVPTRTLTLGGAQVLESSSALSIKAKLKASRPLVWDETGYRFETVTTDVQRAEAGSELSFIVPRTDVAGWRDPRLNAIIDVSEPGSFTHQYTLEVTFILAGRDVSTTTIGPFTVPDGEGPLDLDKVIPAGTTAGQVVSIPDSWTATVAAAQAAADDALAAAQAAEAALIDSDAFIGAKIDETGSATQTALNARTAVAVAEAGDVRTAVDARADTRAAAKIAAALPRTVLPTWTKIADEQARPAAPLAVAIGDSFTDNNQTSTTWNGASASRTNAFRADGYLVWAMIALRQCITWWDVGISGQTAADGLARFDADVTPLRPQIVIEAFGSNDMAGGRTAEAAFADKHAMWEKAWAFGAAVVATTAPPRNTYTAAQEQQANKLNAMLRNFAATNPARFALVDWFPTFCDAVTGDWKTDLVDAAGVHPNTKGAALAGINDFATAIRRFVSQTFSPLPSSNVNDLDNLISNGLMTSNTGSITANRGLTGTVPSGWTATSTGTDANMASALSQVARADGLGNWLQVNTTTIPAATTYVGLLRSARAEYAAGDVVQAVIEFETDAAGWTDGVFDLQILAVNGATILNLGAAMGVGNDTIVKYRPTSGVLKTPAIVVPAGTTELRASLQVGGLGIARFGRCAIRKMPTT